MKKFIQLLFVITSFTVSQSLAQTLLTQVKPFKSKTWGYANIKGEMVIPAQFEKCYKFTGDGYATIYDTKNRQYYFINSKGEKLNTEISSFKLRDGFGFDVSAFNSGVVPVKIGEKWGYLSVTGKVIVQAKYDEASDFNGGYGVVRSGINYTVLSTKGEEFFISVPGVTDVKPFTENMAPYRAADKKMGFIGIDGKIAIPAQFESVGYFTNGLAWAKTTDNKLGYINPKGEWVIKPNFEAAKNFDAESGLARIKNGDKWAYVNKSGEITYVGITDTYGDFSEGLAEGKSNGKTGFYGPNGQWVIQPQFDGSRDFKNGYAAAKQGDRWGMIDKSGKWVIQPVYDGIKDMELIK
ncbi:MAG: WG repeat-containing protein [Bacteroidetes bacterium]|nr:WG repeat-containing protein [Bacteroidota bacterium]